MVSKQKRSLETQKQILDATMARLTFTSAEELRISDICKDTGLSSNGIYFHFGSRQGIIDQAYLELYKTQHAQMNQLLEYVLSSSSSTQEYLLKLDELREANLEQASIFRNLEVQINARAISNKKFLEQFKPVKTKCMQDAAAIFENHMKKGFFESRITPMNLAILFVSAVMLLGIHDETVGSRDINPIYDLLLNGFSS